MAWGAENKMLVFGVEEPGRSYPQPEWANGFGKRSVGDCIPVLFIVFFQNFLYPSYLAIFQPYFDSPVMFWSTCQNIPDHPFCKHPGSLVFF
jgi:hypothetical protein